VSKPWNPRRQTVALKPSRIRREPVRLETRPPAPKRTQASMRERELRGGIVGVLLLTAAMVVVTVGVSAFTFFRDDPDAAARAARFGQCYNSGDNCVVDGQTIYVRGTKVDIAGIDAPKIRGAACADEKSRGIEAAIELAALLNSGAVTVSGAGPLKSVAVDGRDVGQVLVDRSLARRAGDENVNWCA
jgi:endonuclease YncB( thermonuclease family)